MVTKRRKQVKETLMRYLVVFLWMLLGGLTANSQSIEAKLLSRSELDSADVVELAVFDAINIGLDQSWAIADTTVAVSDSVLYCILRFGDTIGVNAFFFLMSYDSVRDTPIDLVYLHDSPDIEQSTKRYAWVEHVIWGTGEIGTIEYDFRVSRPGTLHERTTMQATGRRFWRVGLDGRITGGDLIPEE